MHAHNDVSCAGCGVRFPTEQARRCPICHDHRQIPPEGGQQWLDAEALADHANTMHRLEPGIESVGMAPRIGIGHRALLLTTPGARVLWDCPPVLTEHAATSILDAGPIDAIALSHPHFYGAAATIAHQLAAPVYSHADDAAWMPIAPEHWTPWTGDRVELSPGITIHRLGGHFPGSSILSVAPELIRGGVVLSGDTLHPAQDGRSISCMFSFPRGIPLDRDALASIRERVEPLTFDRLYGGFDPGTIPSNARDVTLGSLDAMIER